MTEVSGILNSPDFRIRPKFQTSMSNGKTLSPIVLQTVYSDRLCRLLQLLERSRAGVAFTDGLPDGFLEKLFVVLPSGIPIPPVQEASLSQLSQSEVNFFLQSCVVTRDQLFCRRISWSTGPSNALWERLLPTFRQSQMFWPLGTGCHEIRVRLLLLVPRHWRTSSPTRWSTMSEARRGRICSQSK